MKQLNSRKRKILSGRWDADILITGKFLLQRLLCYGIIKEQCEVVF